MSRCPVRPDGPLAGRDAGHRRGKSDLRENARRAAELWQPTAAGGVVAGRPGPRIRDRFMAAAPGAAAGPGSAAATALDAAAAAVFCCHWLSEVCCHRR